MTVLCFACRNEFRDKNQHFGRLAAIQQKRTKRADGTGGDSGSALVRHCNFCIIAYTLVKHNDQAIVRRATKKLSKKHRMHDSLKWARVEVIRVADPTNQKDPPLIQPKTIQATNYLNQAFLQYVLHNTDNGSEYMAANPGCSPYDYIFDNDMFNSVSNTFRSELFNIRGLYDFKERCECGRECCENYLAVRLEFQSAFPFLSEDGKVIPVAGACIWASCWEKKDARFNDERWKKDAKYLRKGMKAYDDNNPKGPSAYELVLRGETRPLDAFLTTKDNKKVFREIRAKKNNLGFASFKQKDKKRPRLLCKKTKDEQKDMKNNREANRRTTTKYNTPEARFKRNSRNRRRKIFTKRNGGNGKSKFVLF